MNCPNCAAPIDAGDAFCSNCGTDLRTTVVPETPPESPAATESGVPWETPAEPEPSAAIEAPAASAGEAQDAVAPEGPEPAAAEVVPAPATSPSPPADTAPIPAVPAPPAPPSAPPAPTHVVPPSGMQAWPAPDPTAAVIAVLQPGVELAVTERRGAWARVIATNGWSGWVDGRLLVERGAVRPATPAAAPAAGGGLSIAFTKPLATAGAVAVLVATFLPWLSTFGFSSAGFDVPFMFLIDPAGSHSDTFSVGIVTLLLGVLGAAAALVRGYSRWLRPIGAVAVAVGAVYLIQLYRQASDAGLGFMDIVGAAPFVAIVGGALLLTNR